MQLFTEKDSFWLFKATDKNKKPLYWLSLPNLLSLMSSRSKLSLEKDEFNFAFMLAHDLRKFPALECIDLTPQERLQILSICIRLEYYGTVKPGDIEEIKRLLGNTKTSRLQRNGMLKARLETDFVNS
ncbi:MAG: hypothetical protein AAF652_04705 [Cyanobacteria bacterium P01_C01_bin.72]